MFSKSSQLVVLLLVIASVALCASESNGTSSSPEKTTTKRWRFTRRSTTPTTTELIEKETTGLSSSSVEGSSPNDEASTESTVAKQLNETQPSIESSVVTGSPSIAVEITSPKKSLHVRNCGERIGDDIPFIAILVHTNPYETDSAKSKRSLSKGVLISENFVLATVSSIYHSESFWTVSSVRLGDFVTWNKFANRDKSHSIEVEVDEIFYHKKKDLALIKLKETVVFTDVIRPACLPISDSYNFNELQSHLCKRSINKMPADVTLEFAAPLSTFDCKQFFFRKKMSISHQEFCVWDESGDDCTGDIGNPLFTTHNGRLSVVGLRSYAETDDDDFIDPSEYPAVYVKIGTFLEWISSVVNYNETTTQHKEH